MEGTGEPTPLSISGRFIADPTPGTALGSFALRGSATVLFETSSQTQYDGSKGNGKLTKQIEIGLGGLVDSVADDSIDSLDPEAYEEIPNRAYPEDD